MGPGNPFIWHQKVKVTNHKHIAGVGLCTLVSAGFFRSFWVTSVTVHHALQWKASLEFEVVSTNVKRIWEF